MSGGAFSGFLLDHISAVATLIGGTVLLALASLTIGRGERIQASPFNGHSGAAEASHKALAQLSAQVDLQANVLGFVNAFWVMGLLVLCLVPLPFIMRRPSREETSAGAAVH